MLSTAEDIFQMFLDGIRKNNTATVLPSKFVRIYNEWGVRDWMKTHGLFDQRIEQDKVIRDKFRNLIEVYFYSPLTDRPWYFNIPDGVIVGIGIDDVDPLTITGVVGGGNDEDTIPSVTYGSVMPKYLRHLSAMFKLDYDTNTAQECTLTGLSDWLNADMIFGNDEGVLSDAYYFKPSDSRLYYKLFSDKIRLINGNESQPKYILLEYVKYPNEMSYDDDDTTWEYTIDLTVEQIQEVVDSCVRLYLERINSERYKTFFSEEKVRHQ